MRTRGGVAAACLLMMVLAGCAADESSDAPARGVDAVAEGGGETAPDAEEPAAGADRDVVTTGWVTMTVDDPTGTAQQLVALAESLGGYVSERTENAGDDDTDASAHVVMRVPAQDVTSTIERLRTLGTIEDFSLERTDVTLQLTDLEARIRAYELSVARLEDLLEGATSTADLVQAEQMLTDRQAQLDALRAQATVLADQVDMSTLEVSLWTPEAVPAGDPDGFWEGVVQGWESLVDALRAVLVAVGVALPWLAFVALVVLLVVLLARTLGRRRAARGGGTGPTTSLPPGPQQAWAGHTPGRPAPAAPMPAAPMPTAPAGPPTAAAPPAPPAPPAAAAPSPPATPHPSPAEATPAAEAPPARKPPARRRTDPSGPSSTRPRGGKPGKPGTPPE